MSDGRILFLTRELLRGEISSAGAFFPLATLLPFVSPSSSSITTQSSSLSLRIVTSSQSPFCRLVLAGVVASPPLDLLDMEFPSKLSEAALDFFRAGRSPPSSSSSSSSFSESELILTGLSLSSSITSLSVFSVVLCPFVDASTSIGSVAPFDLESSSSSSPPPPNGSSPPFLPPSTPFFPFPSVSSTSIDSTVSWFSLPGAGLLSSVSSPPSSCEVSSSVGPLLLTGREVCEFSSASLSLTFGAGSSVAATFVLTSSSSTLAAIRFDDLGLFWLIVLLVGGGRGGRSDLTHVLDGRRHGDDARTGDARFAEGRWARALSRECTIWSRMVSSRIYLTRTAFFGRDYLLLPEEGQAAGLCPRRSHHETEQSLLSFNFPSNSRKKVIKVDPFNQSCIGVVSGEASVIRFEPDPGRLLADYSACGGGESHLIREIRQCLNVELDINSGKTNR
ncbi:conserved hypothetical protein [Culex quinquefasciatus]|uniref:Uncharacterized protein n=1 Tax=Culex quinquefasciatus TaxID=7176 RepID=B0X271_CULQU|nr:conserved hypothetical protein [Culex quinquefasciatus]|eukprot:XP_001863743.1 conserved hypothetical protein [Culex quinquefasciatus]